MTPLTNHHTLNTPLTTHTLNDGTTLRTISSIDHSLPTLTTTYAQHITHHAYHYATFTLILNTDLLTHTTHITITDADHDTSSPLPYTTPELLTLARNLIHTPTNNKDHFDGPLTITHPIDPLHYIRLFADHVIAYIFNNSPAHAILNHLKTMKEATK